MEGREADERGARRRRGRACVSFARRQGCSTFFSVTGRRCAGHRRRATFTNSLIWVAVLTGIQFLQVGRLVVVSRARLSNRERERERGRERERESATRIEDATGSSEE